MSGEAKVTFDAKWGANTRALQKYEAIDIPGNVLRECIIVP